MNEPFIPAGWEQIDHCPFCSSAKYRPYERFGDRLQYSYVLCGDCRLVYQDRRPRYDDAFLVRAYGAGRRVTPGTLAEERVRDREFDEKVWQFSRELEEIAIFDRQRSAVLDVGCSNGPFLLAAEGCYSLRYGVELDSASAEFVSREIGVPVFEQPYERIQTGMRFSCIHMSHILEHIPNPHDWLQKTRELLAPGGILVVAVPNMFAFQRRFKLGLAQLGLRRRRWPSTKTPDHLFEPTVPSMLRLFDMNGYRVLAHYTYSRKDPTSTALTARFTGRRWMMLTNARFYAVAR